MNPNFQLNVDCYKINTWLEQRKKMPKDWQICLKACDAKIQTLLDDPVLREQKSIYEIAKRHKQNFSYPYVIQICDSLQKSKLGKQTNFIGQYTHPTLKNWLALKKYMKKDLTGLLHTSRVINQILKFDLPGVKRNKESLRNQIQVFKRKIDSNNNAIYQNKINFENECKRYNIKGEKVRQEVPRLIQEIPEWFEKIEKQCKEEMAGIIGLYERVCEVSGSKPSELRLLKYFAEKGDDLVMAYEGKVLENVEEVRARKYEVFKEAEGQEWEIEVSGAEDTKTARHETILSNRDTRLQLINNLYELSFFCQALQSQLRSGDTHLLSSQYLKIQPSQQQLTSSISYLNNILSPLNNPHFNQLISLYQHQQSAQRICHKLQLYPTTTKRFIEQNQKLVEKIKEIEGKIKEASEETDLLKGEAARCQKVIEEELSGLMKREVKLVGDINKVDMEY